MMSVTRLFATILAIAGLGLSLAGPAVSQAAPVLAAATPLAVEQPPPVEYHLGAQDKVRVIVYGEESLSGEFFIGGNGKASLPLIGEVQAAGLTVRAFQDEIQNSLKDGYLKDPKVSVEVLTFRPFFIMGEVSKPGQYPYTSDLTVQNAVATAGGFTYRANKGKVYIKRLGEGDEHSYPLTSTTPVAPGDTIRIGERIF